MDKQLFFGYGANKNRSKIKQIIGKDPGEGVGAILEGYTLCVQELKDIPDPSKTELIEIFGNTFKAYTIKKGEGIVMGILWAFTQEEIQKIKEWEYVGIWREVIEVKVSTEDLSIVTVLTEKSMDEFPVTERIDGIFYNEFSFIERAQESNSQENIYYTQQQIEKIRSLIKAQSEVNSKLLLDG